MVMVSAQKNSRLVSHSVPPSPHPGLFFTIPHVKCMHAAMSHEQRACYHAWSKGENCTLHVALDGRVRNGSSPFVNATTPFSFPFPFFFLLSTSLSAFRTHFLAIYLSFRPRSAHCPSYPFLSLSFSYTPSWIIASTT